MVLILRLNLCIFFLYYDVIDALSCPSLNLVNGKVKYFNRGKKVKLSCFKPYDLIGNSKLDCYNREWTGSLPICAMKNCDKFPKLLHGKITYYNEAAIAKSVCDSDFTLIGSPFMICDESGWNDTAPECLADSITQFETCHFEPDGTAQCKWVSKPALFNWTIISSDRRENSYLPDKDYPSHDHSLSPHTGGHFLYLESLFSPSRQSLQVLQRQNGAAKYISPLFPAINDKDEMHCLIFYLYTNGPHSAAVEVLIDDEIAWKNNGSLGDEWHKIIVRLHLLPKPFRVIIEGTGQLGHFSNTAIDDLRVTSGEECTMIDDIQKGEVDKEGTTEFHNSAVTIAYTENEHTTISSHKNDFEIQYPPKAKSHEPIQPQFTTLPNTSEPIIQTTFPVSTTGTTATPKPKPTTPIFTFPDITRVTPNGTTEFKSEPAMQQIPINSTSVNVTNEVEKPLIKSRTTKIITTEKIITESSIILTTEFMEINPESNSVHSSIFTKNETVAVTIIPPSRHVNSKYRYNEKNDTNKTYNNDLRVHLTNSVTTDEKKTVTVAQDQHNQRSFSNNTYLIILPISNNTIVKSNQSKYEYNQQTENEETKIPKKGGDRHSGSAENGLETNNTYTNDRKSTLVMKLNNAGDHSLVDNTFTWIFILTTCGVCLVLGLGLILISTVVPKKYHKYRNKDKSFILRLFNKDNTSGSTSKTDDILVLHRVSNNSS